MPQPPKKLLDQMSDTLRTRHYSYRTEQSYIEWARRYILFQDKRHPAEMDALEIQAFITYLAVEKQVAASTQNQALSAILFLYRNVLHKEVAMPSKIVSANRPKHLPTVLTHPEAMTVIEKMSGVHQLMAKLLYGSGL
jgi:site-specific recombinase XerD